MTAGGTQEAGAIERAGDGPRFAIVGAGLMGRWHADAGVRAGGRLVAICDPDSEAARELAGRRRQISLHSQLAPLLAIVTWNCFTVPVYLNNETPTPGPRESAYCPSFRWQTKVIRKAVTMLISSILF